MNPQLCRQLRDILAALQPLQRHLPERLRIFIDSLLSHSQFLSLQSVATASVSFCGVSPPLTMRQRYISLCKTLKRAYAVGRGAVSRCGAEEIYFGCSRTTRNAYACSSSGLMPGPTPFTPYRRRM